MNKRLLLLISITLGFVVSLKLFNGIDGIRYSGNWDPFHPPYYAVDQDPGTWASPGNDEDPLWIEITLEQDYRIFGVEISGEIPEGVWLSFDYFSEGFLRPLDCSFVSSCTEPVFINFQDQDVVTNRLILNIEGPVSADVKIENVTVIKMPVSPVWSRGELHTVDKTGDVPIYYGCDFLLDGNLETVWRPSWKSSGVPAGRGEKDTGFLPEEWERNQSLYDEDSDRQGRIRGFWDYEGEVVFDVLEPQNYSDLSFYLNGTAAGRMRIFTADQAGWVPAGEIELEGKTDGRI